jgi:hypothetical protein
MASRSRVGELAFKVSLDAGGGDRFVLDHGADSFVRFGCRNLAAGNFNEKFFAAFFGARFLDFLGRGFVDAAGLWIAR